MSVIDQRILIPRSPQVVWGQVSTFDQNPTWQIDCAQVSFLGSRHTGVGVRWRQTNEAGRGTIFETTAWYDGLGYEYTMVEGLVLKNGRGRIRLQEIAEGTIVQWTISYDSGGALGGLRDSLTTRRRLENMMVESLRALYREVIEHDKGSEPHDNRSVLRDGPDYQRRKQYKSPPIEIVDEGAVSLIGSEFALSQPVAITEPPGSPDDTQPRVPAHIIEPVRLQSRLVEEEPQLAMERPTSGPKLNVDAPDIAQQNDSNSIQTGSFAGIAEPPVSKVDTAEISVFEVFGVPRPSQTQPMRPIDPDALEAQTNITTTESKTKRAGARIGLRLTIRQTSLRLRKPAL